MGLFKKKSQYLDLSDCVGNESKLFNEIESLFLSIQENVSSKISSLDTSSRIFSSLKEILQDFKGCLSKDRKSKGGSLKNLEDSLSLPDLMILNYFTESFSLNSEFFSYIDSKFLPSIHKIRLDYGYNYKTNLNQGIKLIKRLKDNIINALSHKDATLSSYKSTRNFLIDKANEKCKKYKAMKVNDLPDYTKNKMMKAVKASMKKIMTSEETYRTYLDEINGDLELIYMILEEMSNFYLMIQKEEVERLEGFSNTLLIFSEKMAGKKEALERKIPSEQEAMENKTISNLLNSSYILEAKVSLETEIKFDLQALNKLKNVGDLVETLQKKEYSVGDSENKDAQMLGKKEDILDKIQTINAKAGFNRRVSTIENKGSLQHEVLNRPMIRKKRTANK